MTRLIAEETLPALLRRSVMLYGNREFLRFEQKTWGFEQFESESMRVAAGLHALGLGQGDPVALMMHNGPEYLASWFGLARLGAVEVPINTAHRGNLLSYLLTHSGSRALIVDAEFLPYVKPLLGNLPALEYVIVLGEVPFSGADGRMTDYGSLLAPGTEVPDVQVKPDDPFAIMYTSGTTGPSKGVVIPHAYALRTGRVIAGAAAYDERDCLYSVLPLFHGNAQFLSVIPALLSGARVVLARRFSAGAFWEEVRANGCTEFNYIGGIIPILMKAPPCREDTENPLRVMVGAGAPADMSSAFERRFDVALIEGYGMTEIGVPITNSLACRKLGTCGTASQGYDLRLVDDAGEDVANGQPGELLVRPHEGGRTMLRYHGMPDQTEEAWRGGWFRTGDYLARDVEGFYSFIDRKKDALRRRGENISSYEVDREVNTHPSVLESAAIAVRSELGEDEVMIVVALRPRAELTAESLLQYCASRMAYFMVPRYVRFVDVMPRTPTERIRKVELRAEGVTPDTYDREATP